MYVMVSVLPSSTTSGYLSPARAASSFLALSAQVWYWTLTLTLGYFVLNWLLTSFTSSGHVLCASDMSQTVSVSLRSFGSFDDALSSSEPHAAIETNMPATPIAAMSLRFTPPSSGMLQPLPTARR